LIEKKIYLADFSAFKGAQSGGELRSVWTTQNIADIRD